jgi:hypothetical protein
LVFWTKKNLATLVSLVFSADGNATIFGPF